MQFQNLRVIFFVSPAKNLIGAPCLRALLRMSRVSPKVLAYLKSMQSRSVIEAITWLGFPM